MILKRRKTATMQIWLKWLGAICVLLLAMVWEHVQATHLDRELIKLHKEKDDLLYQNARLQGQINQWISPSHLDSVARKQYGMKPIDSKQVIGLEIP